MSARELVATGRRFNELFEGPEDVERQQASKARLLANIGGSAVDRLLAKTAREAEQTRRRSFSASGTIVVVGR